MNDHHSLFCCSPESERGPIKPCPCREVFMQANPVGSSTHQRHQRILVESRIIRVKTQGVGKNVEIFKKWRQGKFLCGLFSLHIGHTPKHPQLSLNHEQHTWTVLKDTDKRHHYGTKPKMPDSSIPDLTSTPDYPSTIHSTSNHQSTSRYYQHSDLRWWPQPLTTHLQTGLTL